MLTFADAPKKQTVFGKLIGALLLAGSIFASAAMAQRDPAPGEPGAPYANMNHLAPIGVRTGKYFDIPDSAKGPPVDPAKGYRIEELGPSLYMVTDNAVSSMFMV